jgi:hypothetical protein
MALHVNEPIPINIYFCFLSKMVVGSIEDLQGRRASLLYQILLGTWRSKSTMKIRSITEIHNFRWAPVVGVRTAKVAKTLVPWLRRMAGSYVGRLDTKTTSLRSACLKSLVLQYLGMSTSLPT